MVLSQGFITLRAEDDGGDVLGLIFKIRQSGVGTAGPSTTGLNWTEPRQTLQSSFHSHTSEHVQKERGGGDAQEEHY